MLLFLNNKLSKRLKDSNSLQNILNKMHVTRHTHKVTQDFYTSFSYKTLMIKLTKKHVARDSMQVSHTITVM